MQLPLTLEISVLHVIILKDFKENKRFLNTKTAKRLKKSFAATYVFAKNIKNIFNLVTDDEEFSKDFLQDLKNIAACAERILKKVQDKLEG